MEQGTQQLTPAAAAGVLAWLVGAGADSIVGEAPRNWLAAPPPPPVAAPRPSAPRPVAASPVSSAGAALAAAADSLPALGAALAEFDHPLHRPGTAPQLVTGNLAARLWIVTDLPEPADTPADRLRQRMLAAIGLAPADHAIAALLPWGTPAGRAPRDDEVAAFSPFLARALALAPPRLLLAFGDRAAGLVGGDSAGRGVASMRGRWLAVDGVPLLATFHPRRLLTQPELKRLAWADLQAFADRLAEGDR